MFLEIFFHAFVDGGGFLFIFVSWSESYRQISDFNVFGNFNVDDCIFVELDRRQFNGHEGTAWLGWLAYNIRKMNNLHSL